MQRDHAKYGYKHIKPEFAEGLLSGKSIQLGTFGHYRSLEFDRADRLEGLQFYGGDGIVTYGSIAATTLQQLGVLTVGKKSQGPQGLKFLGNTIATSAPEYPIFCCSRKPDFDRCREKGEVILKIDLRRFAKAICAANGDLRPFRIHNVLYTKQVSNVFTGARPDPVFVKSASFANENETRIVFLSPRPTGAFQISAPRAAQFVWRVKIPDFD